MSIKKSRTVYFVQAGNRYGENVYFPYAAGCVAARAWSNTRIREHYRLGHFVFLRDPIERALERFEEPYMVAFSNYVWNFEYHKALARAVKARWPGCLVLFGGHQVLNDSAAQLEEYPFVDFLVHKAGELPFERLLLALLDGTDLGAVPSLSFRQAGGAAGPTGEIPCTGCDFPSPYLAGLFDGMMREHPSLLFSMTIETNRGCPYSCAFCDWGPVRHRLLRMPMERVKAEIDWAAAHRIEYIVNADGNIGILERDGEIVDYVIETRRRTGYPKKFNGNFAKNSDETVFRLNEKLCAHGLNNGATLSLQSLSPAVLENVGRVNLTLERFRELIHVYNRADVPVYTELILGLPGETFDSFSGGIGTLLAAGMHSALEVYPCELLPNAELSSPRCREKHGLKSVRVRVYNKYGRPENQDEIPEYTDFVCQTNTMPTRDWIRAFLFSTVVQGFHGFGLLSFFAIYLHWEHRLPYERFYLDLMDYARANPSTLAGEQLSFFETCYRELSQGKGERLMCYDPRFGEVVWPLSGALYLRTAWETGRFFEELPAFLGRYGMDSDLFGQLLRFQRCMVRLPGPLPPWQSFDYDFPAYFAAAFAGERPVLEKKRAAISFPDRTPTDNWADFAREYVWYSRKKLVKKRYEVEYD